MAGKIPGSTRKSASRKKATAQNTPSVTPIDQNSSQTQTSSQNQNSPQSIHRVATNATNDTAIINNDETPSRAAEPAGARTTEPTVIRPSHPELVEQIRVRAYELFEQRGRLEGFDQQDWAQAEAEIMARLQREKSA